jgi:orotidine-5'-phosphate decarboxylase
MTWKEKLEGALRGRGSLLCVGLDTDMERFKDSGMDQFAINREVIDSTAEFAAAYKLNAAFYECEGIEGARALERTFDHLRRNHPDVLTIYDAKRGDIGNTSKAYAKAAFDVLGADAITLNGYMGKDAISPFQEYAEKLCFVLCRTSNRSSGEVQDLLSPKDPLYMEMARLVTSWNDRGNLGLVVGATYPEELGRIRQLVGPDMPILVPGVGSQGGDLKKVLELGTNRDGGGILINVSRDIMFAFEKDNVGFQGLRSSAKKAAEAYLRRIKGVQNGIDRSDG